MARCEKCLFDPCLCHLGGFGSEEEENTTEKEIKELVGRRCIVKTSFEGDKLLKLAIPGFKFNERATDIIGTINKFGAVGPGIKSKDTLIQELTQEERESLVPVFFIEYEEKQLNDITGHWYIDSEIIYL